MIEACIHEECRFFKEPREILERMFREDYSRDLQKRKKRKTEMERKTFSGREAEF